MKIVVVVALAASVYAVTFLAVVVAFVPESSSSISSRSSIGSPFLPRGRRSNGKRRLLDIRLQSLREDVATTSNSNDDDEDVQDSLSHWLSSPDLFAGCLNMTAAEVQSQKEKYQAASLALHQKLACMDKKEGQEKHRLKCLHRFQYGKSPFVCQHCWCYKPICLCRDELVLKLPKMHLPARISKVILWTHHQEWTSVSNSGSLLPMLLDKTKLLMKGLPEHDDEFQRMLSSEKNVIVLWPDNNRHNPQLATTTSIHTDSPLDDDSRTSWQQIQALMENGEEAVTLLALEGTWRTARRMASKLPPSVRRVALPADAVFWRHSNKEDDADNLLQGKPPTNTKSSKSILSPLRRQEGGSEDNLCTAEAVTAALVGLGMSQADGNRILSLVEKKVHLTRRYQGKVHHDNQLL